MIDTDEGRRLLTEWNESEIRLDPPEWSRFREWLLDNAPAMLDEIDQLRAAVASERECNRCACGHAAGEHYGEKMSCMGDAPGDATGTVYCACEGFTLSLQYNPTDPEEAKEEEPKKWT